MNQYSFIDGSDIDRAFLDVMDYIGRSIATGNYEDAELRFHNTNNTLGHSIVFNDSTGRSIY